LGFIDPKFFLGGKMALDRQGAIEALQRDVAGPLKMSVEAAAESIMTLATEHMVQAIMDITVHQGIDPAEAIFVAGGGAAGLNCVAIGRRLRCRSVVVTEAAAALAASGALISDLSAHYQAMFHTRSDSFDRDGVNHVLQSLTEQCHAFVSSAGAQSLSSEIDWSCEARYIEQAWEIDVPLSIEKFSSDADVKALEHAFHNMHQDKFAVSDPGAPIETVTWNAEIRCRISSGEPGRLHADDRGLSLPSRSVRFLGSGFVETPVYRFEAIAEGARIEGPAMIESDFTSVVIDPGSTARRDALGNLVIDLGDAA
jgi:N-methylhydantoinase A